jgi:hypothetical protein
MSYAKRALPTARLGELRLASLAPTVDRGVLSNGARDVTLACSRLDPLTSRLTPGVTVHTRCGDDRFFRQVGASIPGAGAPPCSAGGTLRLRIVAWDGEGEAPAKKTHALEWCRVGENLLVFIYKMHSPHLSEPLSFFISLSLSLSPSLPHGISTRHNRHPIH